MKVGIKSFDVKMEVKNNGIEFEVYDTPANGSQFLGDCIVTKSGLIWCPGKTDRNRGKKISWKKFIEQMS